MTCSKCARCHRFEKLQLKTRTFEGDRRGMAVPATLRASGLEDRLGLRIQGLPLRRLAADCGKTLDAELLPGRLDSLDSATHFLLIQNFRRDVVWCAADR